MKRMKRVTDLIVRFLIFNLLYNQQIDHFNTVFTEPFPLLGNLIRTSIIPSNIDYNYFNSFCSSEEIETQFSSLANFHYSSYGIEHNLRV